MQNSLVTTTSQPPITVKQSLTLAVSTSVTVKTISALPVVHASVTAPLVNFVARESIKQFLIPAGATWLQSTAAAYAAETTALGLVTSGYAPYALAAAAGGAVLTGCTIAGGCYYAYKGAKWLYQYKYGNNEPLVITEQTLALALPALTFHQQGDYVTAEQNRENTDFYIARDKLAAIVKRYQTHSTTRSCLAFFNVMANKSVEVQQLSQYLLDNPELQYISLRQLTESITNGKPQRIHALLSHSKIEPNGAAIGGTNRVINEIIDGSIDAELKDCLESLSITLDENNNMPSQQDINKAYRTLARTCHPDKHADAGNAFIKLKAAKERLEQRLGYTDQVLTATAPALLTL